MHDGGRSASSGDSVGNWMHAAIIVSIVWAIAGGYAGIHFPVGPAISAYRICMRNNDPGICDKHLQEDWAKRSAYRLYYGGLFAFAPLPLLWLIAYGLLRKKD